MSKEKKTIKAANHSTPRIVEAEAKTEAEIIRSNAKPNKYILYIIETDREHGGGDWTKP